MDRQMRFRLVRETIKAIEEMRIPCEDKKRIFEDDARRLLRLPIYMGSATVTVPFLKNNCFGIQIKFSLS